MQAQMWLPGKRANPGTDGWTRPGWRLETSITSPLLHYVIKSDNLPLYNLRIDFSRDLVVQVSEPHPGAAPRFRLHSLFHRPAIAPIPVLVFIAWRADVPLDRRVNYALVA